MPDLSALLDGAALPERTVEVCLHGHLVARMQDLERDLIEANARVTTMAERGEARKIADEIEQLREKMREATVLFRVRGLTRKAWAELVAAHPPREDDKEDQAVGHNTETFFPALIVACIVDPEVTPKHWERLEQVMSSRQYEELLDAALATSRRQVSIPFSPAASVSRSASDETSK